MMSPCIKVGFLDLFPNLLNANKSTTKDIESQAIGRAVRLGQKKPVTVTRLITTGTIEEDYYNKNKYDISELQ